MNDKYKKADHVILILKPRDLKMKLFWFLSHFYLVFSSNASAVPENAYEIPKPISIEITDQLQSADSEKDLNANKNAYQRSWFWEISQKSNEKSEINEGPDVLYPKSMLKELAQEGVDISYLEYSRPPGGHQSGIERGITGAVIKWEETIIHPDTGKSVIVVPFTFQEKFPEKDIIREYLMDMNSVWFSNRRPSTFAGNLANFTKTTSDLSCLFLLEIPLESSLDSGFKNGIVITHTSTYRRCFSALGICDGCNYPRRYGVPSTWQVINLKGCALWNERPTKHVFLHALGVMHEHQRTGIHVPLVVT